MTDALKKNSLKAKWTSAVSISVIFFSAYFVLRALPDAQCGFLHYIEIVNENGEIELCATNHAGFLDLSRLKYPIEMELEADGLSTGETDQIRLFLETSGGMTMAPHDLAVTHTKKMHLMVIDPSLEDYHHLHPEPVGLDGRYDFEFTPKKAGTYRVFAEIVPVLSRRQAVATSELAVPGVGTAPQFEKSSKFVIGDIHFELGNLPEDMKTGKDYQFTLDVKTPAGGAVDLEMVMDAKGHMVAFDAEGRGFAHMHPIDSIVTARENSKEEDLSFLFNVPNPGWYRLFAQVQINGEAVFGRFDLQVQ